MLRSNRVFIIKAMLFLLTFYSVISASEHSVRIIYPKDIEHTISYEASETNNDASCVSVILLIDEWWIEIDPDPIPARVESI